MLTRNDNNYSAIVDWCALDLWAKVCVALPFGGKKCFPSPLWFTRSFQANFEFIMIINCVARRCASREQRKSRTGSSLALSSKRQLVCAVRVVTFSVFRSDFVSKRWNGFVHLQKCISSHHINSVVNKPPRGVMSALISYCTTSWHISDFSLLLFLDCSKCSRSTK